jgi:hypothetical protein
MTSRKPKPKKKDNSMLQIIADYMRSKWPDYNLFTTTDFDAPGMFGCRIKDKNGVTVFEGEWSRTVESGDIIAAIDEGLEDK